MQYRVLDLEKDQRNALEKMLKLMETKFNLRKDKKHNIALSNYKNNKALDAFSIEFGFGGYLGLYLMGPGMSPTGRDQSLLQFVVRREYKTSRSNPTAILLEQNDRIQLYHSGRVFNGDHRPRPTMSKTYQIHGHDYYKIGNIDDDNLFEKIMNFHISRFNSQNGYNNASLGDRVGFNPGAVLGGIRSEATFDAKHHPITTALKNAITKLGFKEDSCKIVRPDLLVEKNGKKILFEVKPFSSSHELILALGQLLVYNQVVKADKLYLVSDGMFGSTKFALLIRNFLPVHDIRYLSYYMNENGIYFTDLEKIEDS